MKRPGIIISVPWIAFFILLTTVAFAAEDCATQLGGKCRDVCETGEVPEQGAFLDCGEQQQCCVLKVAPQTPGKESFVVRIDQFAFIPDLLKVKAGAEVTWRNNESSEHTVTAEDGSFASGPLGVGAEFKKKFTSPGTYTYSCEMHQFMTGKIVVE